MWHQTDLHAGDMHAIPHCIAVQSLFSVQCGVVRMPPERQCPVGC